jgi:anaerobic selenocysteine-containing dehydrogenase
MLPDADRVAEAIATRELSVVVDPFLTDSARLATCVLPTTTLLEDDDLLGSYGHHFVGESRPVVAPPPGVRTDLQIMQALAARVGLADVMAGDARAWKERLTTNTLGKHGITLDMVAQGNVRSPHAPPVLFADRKFATETGRVNLITAAAVPRAALAEPATVVLGSAPLVLMALSSERSQSSQWSRKTPGPPVITVHPDSAAGVPDGASARLVSARGSLLITVKHDSAQRRDVALGAKGGHTRDRQNLNALIEARTTDIGEGGALYDERVRIERLLEVDV